MQLNNREAKDKMKRIIIPLFTTVMLTLSMIAPFINPPAAYANPDDTALTPRYEATGQYDIVAAGVGLDGGEPDTITLKPLLPEFKAPLITPTGSSALPGRF